jgi:hypothetical protein
MLMWKETASAHVPTFLLSHHRFWCLVRLSLGTLGFLFIPVLSALVASHPPLPLLLALVPLIVKCSVALQ